MKKFASPGILFATFVVVSIIAGFCLAKLEGQRDRNGVLEVVMLISFFSVIPILIVAAITAKREVSKAPAEEQKTSKRFPFLTPLRLFLFGVSSAGISVLAEQFDVSGATSHLVIAHDVLMAAAVPALWASVIWALVNWTGMRKN